MQGSGATLTWYHDFISPFAYLHWPKVRALMQTHAVEVVPILFAAVLEANGHKGPAEIPAKRTFTYRHVLWQARRRGTPLRFPPAHPFNPLAALRLAVAAGNTPEATTAIYDWIWAQGRDAGSVEALAPLLRELGVAADALGSDEGKSTLRANTEAAIAAGVFGVPTLAVGSDLFWGDDAHAFAVSVLEEPSLLAEAEMQRVASLPVGVRRA
ncbi:2-hydroxychromene-2-carboxylate isomerase [Luteimonas vadosa]|uniref:2-hydroxychromene-2-carboxylate isomerase n=2 Tax=Luteimonas vadosa TaxID=1165507 RepID=A0ABP9DZ95_9GAMM